MCYYLYFLKECLSKVIVKKICLALIFPIPKNRKCSLNDSNSYRGIALGCLLGKLFDLIILHSNKQILTSCSQQFGFKANHSTTQCSFVLTEITQYYKISTVISMYSFLMPAKDLMKFNILNFSKSCIIKVFAL